jgi:hypothetical protein
MEEQVITKTFPLRDALNLVDQRPLSEGMLDIICFWTNKEVDKLTESDVENCRKCLLKQPDATPLRKYLIHFLDFIQSHTYLKSEQQWEEFLEYMIKTYQKEEIKISALLLKNAKESCSSKSIENSIACYADISAD